MDVSTAIVEAGDEGEDLCRICRSPEEPGNPLRYPCACRGSIKYVHQDCLRLWLNHRGYKKCEICGHIYSFVPVYSDNAPERLPCHEFLMGLMLRVSRVVKLILLWIVVILLNTYFFSLHPWGQKVTVEFQRVFGMSWKFASLWGGLFYSGWIVCFMTIISFIMAAAEHLRFPVGFFFVGNGLGQGVIAGAVQVLWKYMEILCDWYSVKFIHYFFGETPGLIDVNLNVLLQRFGVIRRMLFFLNDDAFAALSISIYVSILFVLLPFLVGWIVLATVGGSYLSGNSPVILGYMMMLSISFAYLGILFTLHRNPFPCLLWVFSVKAYKHLSIIKDAFVLYLKFGVLPWVIGCWLKIYTSTMFGTTISPRFETLSHFPSLMTLPWWAGFVFLIIAISYMSIIQEIIHQRAFWYLLDITDPHYKVTKLNLGHTFFVFVSHWILLVIMLHLPIKAITLISPSFFPLELWVTDENPGIGAYSISFFLVASGARWLIKLIEPASVLIVRNWIITVSSWLQLSDFLLIVPHREGFHRADQNVLPLQPRRQFEENIWVIFYAIAEGPMVSFHEAQNVEEQRDNRCLPRIALMLVLAALTLFLISSVVLALPILVGRVFFDSTSFITLRFGLKHDDLCAYWIGCYILRAIYIVSNHIHKGRTDLLIKYISIWIRNGLLFSIWISVIPGLIGLLIELMIIIPSRVPLNESPIYFLNQDWLIGVVALHIWTFVTMLTPINCFATEAWQRKLERLRYVGINNLPTMWLLRDVIGSIINSLLTTLCIPYMLVKSLFPLLGFSQSINSAFGRFIWPALLALVALWFMVKLTRDLVVYLHQLIFDELYVVGERVDDLTEDLVHGV